jgi:hypothetical protein
VSTIILVIIALAVAALFGYFVQRRTSRRDAADDARAQVERIPTADLVVPVRTLAALLLAFVLFSVYQSYKSAKEKAATEAGSVLAMAREAVLLPPSARDDVIGALRCYARAVAGPDWRAQASDGHLSPITDTASDAITISVRNATANPDNRYLVSSILSDDSERIKARIERTEEGRPSVPFEVWLLLLAAVMMMIGGESALGHPRMRRGVQVFLLIGTTIVFGATLLVIYDLDHPYSGPINVSPAAMRTVEGRMAALPGGDSPAPCTEDGRTN